MDKEKILEEIEQLKKTINQANMRLNQLKNQLKNPTFETVEKGKEYHSVVLMDGVLNITATIESGHNIDKRKFEINNYFHTKERAEEVKNKIEFLLKLERLHDVYCSDYKPNWDDIDECKYVVYFDCYNDKYRVDKLCAYKSAIDVYFETESIAQKVCDILNKELNEND